MATYSSLRYNFTPPDATTSAQVGAGAMQLIKAIDASSASTISVVDGTSSVVLDNTYKTYIFVLTNIHPSANNEWFKLYFSIDTGSNYNATKVSAAFFARHFQDDSETSLTYDTGGDVVGTGGDPISDTGTDNDQGFSGTIWLFNPSQTTYVKHYFGTVISDRWNDSANTNFFNGYVNSTSAVDAVQFKFDSGNIDTGNFKLYGIA